MNLLSMNDEENRTAINQLVLKCHQASINAGWEKNLEYKKRIETLRGMGFESRTIIELLDAFGVSENKKRNIGEQLALIHSEVSEAMEGHRKNLMDDKLPHRSMFEVELADAMIRIMDLAGSQKLDLGGAIMEKLKYNATREDHKIENRIKENGKAY